MNDEWVPWDGVGQGRIRMESGCAGGQAQSSFRGKNGGGSVHQEGLELFGEIEGGLEHNCLGFELLP